MKEEAKESESQNEASWNLTTDNSQNLFLPGAATAAATENSPDGDLDKVTRSEGWLTSWR